MVKEAAVDNSVIKQLKGNIEQIISRYESAVYEKEELAKKVRALTAENESFKQKITELETKLEKIQLANAFEASSQDIKEAKQRIVRIVKEIDKCISLLND